MNATQATTLKDDISATSPVNAIAHNSDGAVAVADFYNLVAAPDYFVWRTSVPAGEYTGANGVVWTEVDALTVGKARIFEWMTGLLSQPLIFSDPNKRQGLGDAFTAGSVTRANLTAMGRRRASRYEKLFALATVGGTGTRGSTANPDTMALEGPLVPSDVIFAWTM